MVEQMDIHMDNSDHETRPMADAIFLLPNFPENSWISANLEEILSCSIYGKLKIWLIYRVDPKPLRFFASMHNV